MEVQIKIKYRDGGCHYLYSEGTEENIIEVACKTMNDDLESRKNRDEMMQGMFLRQNYFAPKTVYASEYDKVKHTVKRGGKKFKLRLTYFKATTYSGEKIKKEWYVAA